MGCGCAPAWSFAPDGELLVTSGAKAGSFLLLKCLAEQQGPSALPVRGLGACWVTDAMVRGPSPGAVGKQTYVPLPSPGCWAGGRSLTLVPWWGLEGSPSSELQLLALLSEEAVSVLEAELHCCPRLAPLWPRSLSAQEAAAGRGQRRESSPGSCAGGQCSGRGICSWCCPSTLHHSPAVVGGEGAGWRGMAVGEKVFSMEAPCGGVREYPGVGPLWHPAPGAHVAPRVLTAACVLCLPEIGVQAGEVSQPVPGPRGGGQHPASLPSPAAQVGIGPGPPFPSCMGASPMLCSGCRAHCSQVCLRAEQQG